jgi:hypothetical protein
MRTNDFATRSKRIWRTPRQAVPRTGSLLCSTLAITPVAKAFDTVREQPQKLRTATGKSEQHNNPSPGCTASMTSLDHARAAGQTAISFNFVKLRDLEPSWKSNHHGEVVPVLVIPEFDPF